MITKTKRKQLKPLSFEQKASRKQAIAIQKSKFSNQANISSKSGAPPVATSSKMIKKRILTAASAATPKAFSPLAMATKSRYSSQQAERD